MSRRLAPLPSSGGMLSPAGAANPTAYRAAIGLDAAFTTADLAARVSQALRREFGASACPVKLIARLMDADPRAVREWWEGVCAPSSKQLLRLGQVSGEVRCELFAILTAQHTYAEHLAHAARLRHDALQAREAAIRGVLERDRVPAVAAPLGGQPLGALGGDDRALDRPADRAAGGRP